MITAADGTAFTGTTTVYVTGDGGTQALGGTASGVCTSEGNGFHSYVPTQAETNYAHIGFTFIGSGAIPATLQVYTNFPQTADNDVLAAGANGFAAIKSETALIVADTGELQTTLSAGLVAEGNNETLIEQFKMNRAVTESQRGAHTHQPIGNIYFVDPTNGDTHASGNRGGITDPYATIQDCHDNAVTDSNHDLILLLSGAAAGPTTHTSTGTTTISKRYTFIRGPGRDFICVPSTNVDTFTITADGIELSGMQINTTGVGSGNGVTGTSADFVAIRDVWFNNTQGDAIELTDCDNFVIEGCSLQATGQSGSGHGIQIVAGAAETSSYGTIKHNYIEDIAGDGIQIDTTGGGSVLATTISQNKIQGCTDDGIDIVDAGCVDTFISDNRFGNNAGSNIEDAGTTTVEVNNVAWAKHSIATEARLAELDAANLPADVDAILADTNELQADDYPTSIAAVQATLDTTGVLIATDGISGTSLSSGAQTDIYTAVMTTAMTEAYSTDGGTMTAAQAMYMLWSALVDCETTNSTITCHKLDGTTTSMTFTLAPTDGNPTSRTRAT